MLLRFISRFCSLAWTWLSMVRYLVLELYLITSPKSCYESSPDQKVRLSIAMNTKAPQTRAFLLLSGNLKNRLMRIVHCLLLKRCSNSQQRSLRRNLCAQCYNHHRQRFCVMSLNDLCYKICSVQPVGQKKSWTKAAYAIV